MSETAIKALGLDLGTKTIGVAASDGLGLAAHARKTIARKGGKADLDAVAAEVAAEEATVVVIGLPIELSGKLGPAAKRTMVFVDALVARLGSAVRVETWDERFSTMGAQQRMISGQMGRAKRQASIDAEAAAFILQGWLDARRSKG